MSYWPHIQKLLDTHVKVLEELEGAFLAVQATCASVKAIREEMAFF
jgi:hypothetical protein